jgi:hypothetical protein
MLMRTQISKDGSRVQGLCGLVVMVAAGDGGLWDELAVLHSFLHISSSDVLVHKLVGVPPSHAHQSDALHPKILNAYGLMEESTIATKNVPTSPAGVQFHLIKPGLQDAVASWKNDAVRAFNEV